jgi:hypothetical protein
MHWALKIEETYPELHGIETSVGKASTFWNLFKSPLKADAKTAEFVEKTGWG